MKPAQFEYDDPQTEDEALDLLARHGDDCKVVAGGQSLVPLMNFRLARPARLIDINRIDSLSYIKRENGRLVIGAMARHTHLEHSEEVAQGWPLLTEAIGWVGHAQIRNRGTIGGSVAHADPAAELPAAFAALDATFHVRSKRGSRIIGWNEFFVSEFTTALAPDELVTAVEVPALGPRTGTGFVEFARRHGDFAVGGAAATVTLGRDGVCERATIALLSAGPAPIRAQAAERQLSGATLDGAAIAAASAEAVKGLRPTTDLHGSTEYRIGLLRTMTERALTQATQRARSSS
ncbi:MAG TPA: xanthine dehydrogenase family protein subunit M [Candidatus Dormibacteraeota bacterium]|jgi:carbon-monoxide dehydrogenase medium subunit/6-hydroxypseudooxynicotine dehydrogenase subunit alpha